MNKETAIFFKPHKPMPDVSLEALDAREAREVREVCETFDCPDTTDIWSTSIVAIIVKAYSQNVI